MGGRAERIRYRVQKQNKCQISGISRLHHRATSRTGRNLYVDGASSRHGLGVGIRLESPTGEVLEQSFRPEFKASNNEAAYEALIAGLRLAKEIGVKRIQALCDSQLFTNQFNGDYDAKNERMGAYVGII